MVRSLHLHVTRIIVKKSHSLRMEKGSEISFQIPKIDFSGLDLSCDGRSSRWEATRAQLMDAIETHGFFEAALDDAKLPASLLKDVFDQTLGELFSVPAENKIQALAGHPFYEGHIRIPAYEILIVTEPHQLASLQSFASIVWPQQGNPSFCDKIMSISKALRELDLMILRMLFEGLGVDRHYESLVNSTKHSIRLVRYDPQEGEETNMINMKAHMDMNLISFVYQGEEEGLEVMTHDGHWVQARRNSFTVLIAETLMAITNGKLKSTVHRVRRARNETARYSLGFISRIREGVMIDALEELVDKEHPKLFKPFDYHSYMKFFVANKFALRSGDSVLQLYCGMKSDNAAA